MVKASENIEGFNPFPGLRPFSVAESHLFFGREGQSEEVLAKLAQKRFVAVVGASGSGKSSLMYCGITPILQGGFIAEAGSHWRIVSTKPGSDPIGKLATALVNADVIDRFENTHYREAIISSVLRAGSNGLAEAIRQLKPVSNENILIQVDQFEELFRFRRSKSKMDTHNETLAFIQLILHAVRQTNLPIYVVLTMRSDFIGECSHYSGLTALINESHYLIPQMTRDDFRMAVSGPVAVAGGKITERLLHQLLNDIGDNADQLPILQHAMMRTWEYWQQHASFSEPLDVPHYTAIGRMEKALSLHANEAYNELRVELRPVCEKMFKALTEIGSDNRGIRHPTSIRYLAKISSSTVPDVIEIIAVFRKNGRSFLSPSAEVKLYSTSVVDISHESLMRIWDKLKVWVSEESLAIQMYKRLASAAEQYQKGDGSLWRPPDLFLALTWRESQKPNPDWAVRHNAAFERTMVYLETCENEYLAEEGSRRRMQQRALRRSRIFAIILGVAALVSLGFLLYSFTLRVEAEQQKVEAQRQRQIALVESGEAENQRKIALSKSEFAIKKSREADRERRIAEREKEFAMKQQAIARRNALLANQQKELADLKSREADSSARVATAQQIIAEQKSIEAALSAEQANGLRMQSVARSMAVKAQQLSKNAQLQSLLAYQSFAFNKEYKGFVLDNDIYNSVYSSLQQVAPELIPRKQIHTDALRSLWFSSNSSSLFSVSSDGRFSKTSFTSAGFTETENIPVPKQNWKKLMKSELNNQYLLITAMGSFYIINNNTTPATEPTMQFNYFTNACNLPKNRIAVLHADSLSIVYLDDFSIHTLKLDERGTAIKFDKNSGTLAVGTENGKYLLMDVTEQVKRRATVLTINEAIYAIAFSAKKNHIAIGYANGTVSVYDSNDQTRVVSLELHAARVSSLNYSANNSLLVSAGYDGLVNFLPTTLNYSKQAIALKQNNTWIMTAELVNEQLMVAYKDGFVQVWDLDITNMANNLYGKLERNFSKTEWNRFVGTDIEPRKTHRELPWGQGIEAEKLMEGTK